MRITNEIVQQIVELGGRDDMTIILRQSAWDELQIENPPQLNAETIPPTIFGLPIKVNPEAIMEVQVLSRA